MRIYKCSTYNAEDYRAALAKCLHDEFAVSVLELQWHGTLDYLRFIERDGLPAHRALLAKIRSGLAFWSERAELAKDGEKNMQGAAKQLRQAAKSVDISRRVGQALADRHAAEAKTHDAVGVLLKTEGAKAAEQATIFRDLDERLTAALMYYTSQHPGRSLVNSPAQTMAITLRQDVKMPTVNVSGRVKKKAAI
jgi:hypothetical protein